MLIDPPFITREVWAKYALAARYLAKEDHSGRSVVSAAPDGPREDDPPACKFLCTTIFENREFMREFLDLRPAMFRPSIPNLVYQYCCYVNYVGTERGLQQPNGEIYDDTDWEKEALVMEAEAVARREQEDRARGMGTRSPPIRATRSPPIRGGTGGGWTMDPTGEEESREVEGGVGR